MIVLIVRYVQIHGVIPSLAALSDPCPRRASVLIAFGLFCRGV